MSLMIHAWDSNLNFAGGPGSLCPACSANADACAPVDFVSQISNQQQQQQQQKQNALPIPLLTDHGD